jgi:transcriptional regulator with XRE-family HTH domain
VTIRELREAWGWTQAELANRVEVSESTVYAWENGRAQPTRAHLAKLAEALGVAPAQLMEGEG